MIYVSVSGERVPALGFGTWQLNERACRDVVREALAMGYRHIDTAQSYGNETEIGGAIRMSEISRDELFLVTKLTRENLRPEDVHASTRESLKRLAVEVIDMIMIHWPNDEVALEDTLGALVALQDDGLIRHIGVSNFSAELLDEALRLAPISAVQVECHPFLQQTELRGVAREAGIMFIAYSPLAQGKVARDPVLQEIGRRHDKTATQVALRWLIQHPQVAVIPKAGSLDHMAENFDIFDFSLTVEECRELYSLDRGERLIDPEWAHEWQTRPASEIRREANKAVERADSYRSQPSSARHPHE